MAVTLMITLRAARVNAGLTQKEAADQLQISNKTLVKWEKRPDLVPAGFQKKLSGMYNIPIDNLIFLNR